MSAGGLLLARALGESEPKGQVWGINLLFWALVAVVAGSLLGEFLGINQLLGNLWFWFGHQGWEYLDLGRGWQIMLALGLVLWTVLLFRGVAPALRDPERKEISWLFMLSASTIPIFYLPAFFFGSTTEYSIVDNWRFWIIHLWVEGFFELFVTVMVAVIFYRLGVVSRLTAARIIYLDAILFLGSRDYRHGASLVLDGPVQCQSCPLCHILGYGGCSPDASHSGCLGFYQTDEGQA